MEFLANNFVHILNMKNIAIDTLCNKANICSSSIFKDFNLDKYIPFLLERYIFNVSCSWAHNWSINTSYIYTVWSTLHQYIFYFIPLLVPFFYSISNLMFNILEMFLHFLYYSLRFLSHIISNLLLLIIWLI
jgi:hypothetical protein